ncbi:MAG TPA: DoxX family protein [Devosiaceae bacterium]|jgi:putative oxidoreductase
MFDSLSRYSPYALMALRIMSALLFLQAGILLLFNFPTPTMEIPHNPLTIFTGIMELVGGILLVIGLFTRPVAFLLSGMMAIGYFWMHAPVSFFPSNNMGGEAILFCFVFLYIFFAGPGAFSVDQARARST